MGRKTALVFGTLEHDYTTPRGARSINFHVRRSAFESRGLPIPASGLRTLSDVTYRQLMALAAAAQADDYRPVAWYSYIVFTLSEALTAEEPAHGHGAIAETCETRFHALLIGSENLCAETGGAVDISAAAQQLGVSSRSLQRAVKGLSGLSAAQYFRLLRLHQFRRRLVSYRGDFSITRLALEHGFENVGRLSRYYQGWFGELPSKTRRSVAKPVHGRATDS